jgi:hypothetical protein
MSLLMNSKVFKGFEAWNQVVIARRSFRPWARVSHTFFLIWTVDSYCYYETLISKILLFLDPYFASYRKMKIVFVFIWP